MTWSLDRRLDKKSSAVRAGNCCGHLMLINLARKEGRFTPISILQKTESVRRLYMSWSLDRRLDKKSLAVRGKLLWSAD
jgi:hypothetical protein